MTDEGKQATPCFAGLRMLDNGIMNRRNGAIVVAAVLLAGCGSSSDTTAGKVAGQADGAASRVDVKHAIDPDAKDIDQTPKDISVEELLATKLPDGADLGKANDRRIGDFEKSTFRVNGTLKSVVLRKDGDYYMVMQGKSGATAVIEVPDPKLAKGSPIYNKILAARNAIESKYHPTDKPKDINEPATIEGVGFYGWKSKQGAGGHGSSPRLMPGTGFTQGKS